MRRFLLLALGLPLTGTPPASPPNAPNAPAAALPAAYPHQSMTAQGFGEGPRSYWIFEPASPRPASAPVVVFHHGWMAVNPGVYGAWIEHLTRSGRIVIFPRYQSDLTTRPAEFLPNARAAVLDALDVLETAPGRVRPDRSRFALIGHSAGGNLSAQMAATALGTGLPEPRAVIAVCPGEVRPILEPHLSTIPATSLLVVAAAEDDRLVGECAAREIFAEATSIPAGRKKFILYRSDHHGPVPILADHLSPTAGLPRLDSGEGVFRSQQMGHATLDLLDRHGFWRMADLTLNAAFAGQTLDEATEHGALFRDLGHWSDGRPVTPPLCTDDPDTIPRLVPTNGVRLVPWNADELRRMVTAERR